MTTDKPGPCEASAAPPETGKTPAVASSDAVVNPDAVTPAALPLTGSPPTDHPKNLHTADAATNQPRHPMLTPELIEKLRQTGIRLDRQGRFWHENAEVTHSGFRRALLRWMDRLEDGRSILRLDQTRYAYVEVEDAHLLALSARWQDDRAFLTLNDGSEEELDYASLRVGSGDALYCAVRRGRLDARITTPAYYALAERIAPVDEVSCDAAAEQATPSGRELFALRARGREFVIG